MLAQFRDAGQSSDPR